jgi:hypothetical protein
VDDEQSRLSPLLNQFYYLSKHYAHAPGRNATAADRRHFDQAQIELFQLAQAICAIVNPEVQLRLDLLREEIMAQLRLALKTSATGAVVVRRKAARPTLWWEYQITPELTHDPTIVGSAVLRPYVTKLKQALRDQAAAIRARLP